MSNQAKPTAMPINQLDAIVINTCTRHLKRFLTEQGIERIISRGHFIALKFFMGTAKAVSRDDLELYLNSET